MSQIKPTLQVTGTCTFPTAGYQVTLAQAVPQGFNPNILILDLNIVKPAGIVTQVVTTQMADFTKETASGYTDVQIQPDGITVPVKVTQ